MFFCSPRFGVTLYITSFFNIDVEHKLYFMLQVVLDLKLPKKALIEIKSVLVVALASHGQLSEAFLVYEQIKTAGHNLEPKAVTCLIVRFCISVFYIIYLQLFN